MSSQNIFALFNTPAHAAMLQAKCNMAIVLIERVRSLKLSTTRFAQESGLTMPQAKSVMEGALHGVSTDQLIAALVRLGCDVNSTLVNSDDGIRCTLEASYTG